MYFRDNPMKNKKLMLSVALSCLLLSAHSHADTSVGAYVNYDGWNVNTIDQFNADTARNAATINVFSSFSSDWSNLSQQAGNVVSRGSVPLITWMPYNSAEPDSNVLAEITQGQWDTYIAGWIEGLKSWRSTYADADKPSVLIRFGHEFNGNWYPWGNKPEDLKAAWRYLHAAFTEAGLNDVVGWVWCANNVDVDSYNNVMAYYPGDDVVDWLSLDGYNWGSNYSFTHWKSFDETFSQQYVKMVSSVPNKPMMLAEVSSAEPHDLPDQSWGQDGDDSDVLESKEAWTTDMMQSIQADYPAIKSIVWFNTNKELSWALNETSNTGLTAYNKAVVGDYFGGVLPIKSSTTMTEPTPIEEAPVKPTRGKGKSKKTSLTTATISDSSLKTATTSEAPLTGLDKATTVSRMPAVVGLRLLAQEAEGLRNMSKDNLTVWRLKRLQE